jgi:hypothetical protein
MADDLRPKSWRNWQERDAGKPSKFAYEHELYSDAVVNGIATDFGPYRLLNPIAGPRRDETCRPVAVLRIDYHVPESAQDGEIESGGVAEEMSSLMSLCLAIRVRAGPRVRIFHNDDDLRGEPRSDHPVNRPYLAHGSWTPIVARTNRTVDFDELGVLENYPKLSPENATALVRAARLYQDALWVSEREAALTWLFLVSAVETAALAFYKGRQPSPVEMLRDLRPNLAAACGRHGEEHLAEVAKQLAHVSGAQKRFLDFVEEFRPDPPSSRPAEYRQDWEWKPFKQSLKLIYGLRSQALHAGDQVPLELCIPPEPFGSSPSERRRDYHAESRDHHHRPAIDEKFPMLLHVFEYVVQGCLVKWWATAASVS